MFVQCWASGADDRPTLKQHWFNVPSFREAVNHIKTSKLIQQTRHANTMSIYCWASGTDGGPTLNQHWCEERAARGPARNQR